MSHRRWVTQLRLTPWLTRCQSLPDPRLLNVPRPLARSCEGNNHLKRLRSVVLQPPRCKSSVREVVRSQNIPQNPIFLSSPRSPLRTHTHPSPSAFRSPFPQTFHSPDIPLPSIPTPASYLIQFSPLIRLSGGQKMHGSDFFPLNSPQCVPCLGSQGQVLVMAEEGEFVLLKTFRSLIFGLVYSSCCL